MTELVVMNDGKEIDKFELINTDMILIHPGKDGMMTEYSGKKFYLDSSNLMDQKYVEVVRKLKAKYPNFLSAIVPERIAFVIDLKFVNTEKTTVNSGWFIDIKRATSVFGKYASNMFNLDYVVSLRSYWMKEWQPAQLHAAILSQLLRIDQNSGAVVANKEPHSSKCVATFGLNYLEPGVSIADVIEVKVELMEFAKAEPAQVSFEEAAKKVEETAEEAAVMDELEEVVDLAAAKNTRRERPRKNEAK